MRVHFLGAAGQVTGSRYVLETGDVRVMIDCGLFQERAYLARNWEMPLADPGSIDAILLTHAHLDHVGLIPRLVAGGYDRPIIATEPSVALAAIVLRDSGRIQEEDAAHKRRRHRKEGRRGPRPETPLYTGADAEKVIPLLRPVRYETPVEVHERVTATFHEAGHILGAASIAIDVQEDGVTKRIVFSGDLGQWGKPLIGDPTLLREADVVVMESTYGDRNHRDEGDVATRLAEIVRKTVARGGNLLIPTFAIERAQELVYLLGRLAHRDQIPDVPVFLDSPMAADVTDVFREFREYLDPRARRQFERGEPPLQFPGFECTRSVDESRAINTVSGPKVIMSTSGMCTAGRIKHHLRQSIHRADSTVLFVGYQPPGTLGRQILDGRPEVRIHGCTYPVNARIAQLHGFSAHADRDDLLRWIGHFEPSPQRVFLTHGDAAAAKSLSAAIEDRIGIVAHAPEYRESIEA